MSKLKHSSPPIVLAALAMLGAQGLLLGAEAPALVDRVPILSGSAEEVRNGYSGLESAAAALERDLEAAEAEVQERQRAAMADSEAQLGRQMQNFENFTGLSEEDLESMDDGEAEAAMLGAFGMSMDDLEAMEGMDEEEIEALFAEGQFDTSALQQFGNAAPTVSDPALFARLSQEYGDWSVQDASRSAGAAEQFLSMRDGWEQQHVELDSRLDAELSPRLAGIPNVDCGEAGDIPDAIAVHALAVERAAAHADLAPQQLRQGVDYLLTRRDQVKADAVFAQRFADESRDIVELAVQGTAVQQLVLQRISELLAQTMETARNAKSWIDAKTDLEGRRPTGECG